MLFVPAAATCSCCSSPAWFASPLTYPAALQALGTLYSPTPPFPPGTRQVLVCRASLQQLLDSGRPLHARLPRPVTLRLQLMPPAPPPGSAAAAVAVIGGGGGGGAGAGEGWYGSTAVMSYFLSELGRCYTVNTLSVEVGACAWGRLFLLLLL